MIFVHGNDGYGSSIWESKHKQVQGEKILFTERFPTRKIPNEKTFQRVIERLRNHVHQAKS